MEMFGQICSYLSYLQRMLKNTKTHEIKRSQSVSLCDPSSNSNFVVKFCASTSGSVGGKICPHEARDFSIDARLVDLEYLLFSSIALPNPLFNKNMKSVSLLTFPHKLQPRPPAPNTYHSVQRLPIDIARRLHSSPIVQQKKKSQSF